MDNRGNDYSHTVFKLAGQVNLSDYKLDVALLNVALAMDGQRPLMVIAEEDRYDLQELTDKVERLLALGVIEVNQSGHTVVERDFIDFLCGQLSRSIGPIADFLIADTAKDLGHPISSFPVHKIPTLINLLVQEINTQEEANAFRRAMAAMIKKKNY